MAPPAAGADADESAAGAADWSSFFEQPTVTTAAVRSVASIRGSFFIWSSFYVGKAVRRTFSLTVRFRDDCVQLLQKCFNL